MRPPSFIRFLLFVVLLTLALPLAVFAGDAAPPHPARPLTASRPPSAVRREDARSAEGWQENKQSVLPRPTASTMTAGAAEISLGQPGTSFRYVTTYGVTEAGYFEDNNHLNFPYGVAVDGDTVWIAEEWGHRVMQFKSDGSYVSQIGKAGLEDSSFGPLAMLRDVAIDAAGNRWIVDAGAAHILQISPEGELLRELGAPWDHRCGADAPWDRLCFPVSLAFDAAGNMYLSDEELHVVRVMKPDGSYLAQIGAQAVAGTANDKLNRPQHLAVDDGRLYVADSANHRVQIYDVSTPGAPRYVATIGTTGVSGSDATHVAAPYGVAVDATEIYIAESDGHQVSRWRRDTLARAGVLSNGWGDGRHQFRNPRDVAVDAKGNIYVADWQNARVQQFGIYYTWDLVRTLGTTGVPYLTDNYHYNSPMAVAGGTDGSVYLVEWDGNRLVKLDALGAPAWVIGQPRTIADQCENDVDRLCRPHGVAVDTAGKVYVADSENGRIQVFTSTGAYYATIGTGWGQDNYEFSFPRNVAVGSDGKVYVADQENQRIQIFDSQFRYLATLGVTGVRGSDGTHLDTPVGVAVDSHGTIYVAEEPNHRVKVYGSDLTYRRSIGGGASCDESYDAFCGPHQLAVDAADNLYVADSWHNRIQVFDPEGRYLTTVAGDWGTGNGQMRGPAGVAIGADGAVLAADGGNHRVQKFAAGVPGWKQVNINGFGDRNHMVGGAFASFAGSLYHATRAELWRMDAQGGWALVRGDGFGDPNNWIDDLFEFKGQLYVSLGNQVCDDADCNTSHSSGGAIWRSGDGQNWSPVMAGGFGDTANTEVLALMAFGGQLYAGTWTTDNTHGAEIWRSATGNAGEWTRVVAGGLGDANDIGVVRFSVFEGQLYAGSYNELTGGRVWRSGNGTDWQPVTAGGLGGTATWYVSSLATYGDKLYAGTYNRTTGGQLWRCAKCDGTDWSRVAADVFGRVENRNVAALTTFHGALYSFTSNRGGDGIEVRRTFDGESWTLAAPAGFGDSNNNFPFSAAVHANRLFVSVQNVANGSEVWATTVTADFTATPARGRPPLTVQFTNTSAGDYTTSLWDFGDGQTSTETNPSHTYTKTGVYTVKLTVGDGTDSDTVTREAAVRAGYWLYLPTVTKNYDPPLYDSFENHAYDGAFDPSLWEVSPSPEPGNAWNFNPQQAGGVLTFANPNGNYEYGDLKLKRPGERSLKELAVLQAKFRQDSSCTANQHALASIRYAAKDVAGWDAWVVECSVCNACFTGPSGVFCAVTVWKDRGSKREYNTGAILPVDLTAWQTLRIESDPNTAALKFYLNGTVIGSYNPPQAQAILTVKTFQPYINIWNTDGARCTHYVDDVRITPAK